MPGWIFSEDSWTSGRNWTKRTLLLAAFAAAISAACAGFLSLLDYGWFLEAPAKSVFPVIPLGVIPHTAWWAFRLQFARSPGSVRQCHLGIPRHRRRFGVN